MHINVITSTRNYTVSTVSFDDSVEAYAYAVRLRQQDPTSRSMLVKYEDDGDIITFVWDGEKAFTCVEDLLNRQALKRTQ